MSAPHPQQSQRDSARPRFELRDVLILAAAGAGAVGYLLGFFDESALVALGSNAGFALIAAAVLAGLRFVPRTPNGLYAAAPLAAYAALALLQQLVRGTAGGLGALLVLLAVVQCGAVFAVLLADGGMVKIGGPAARAQPRSPQPPPGGPRGPAGPRFGPGPSNGGWSPQAHPPQAQPPQAQPPQAQPAQGPPAHPGPPNPPWAQPQTPGSRPPSSDGVPVPGAPQPEPSTQQSPPSGPQPAGKPDQPDNGGPQGTRQMPHPGANQQGF